jgi:hypothetical protein
MTSDEKVLAEIKDHLKQLGDMIVKMQVSKEERDEFEKQKAEYRVLIDDYKLHKKTLEEKYGKV